MEGDRSEIGREELREAGEIGQRKGVNRSLASHLPEYELGIPSANKVGDERVLNKVGYKKAEQQSQMFGVVVRAVGDGDGEGGAEKDPTGRVADDDACAASGPGVAAASAAVEVNDEGSCGGDGRRARREGWRRGRASSSGWRQ